MARRSELDAALVDLARASGADVRDGTGVVGADQQADRVRCACGRPATRGRGELEAHYAIGADGMWSPLRKALGVDAPGYLGEWHAFRQYFTDVSDAAATELWILFEPDLLPGYFWSFPVGDGQANVGFGILRGGRVATRDMKQLWPELLDRPHVRELLGPDARPEGPHKAWPIPARVDDLVLADGRVLFVGDAAGATDPMTGEGIGQALATGHLGGRVAARGRQRRTDPRRRPVRVDRAARAGRRPPAGRRARPACSPRRRAAQLALDTTALTAVDPAQLRPLDVRGLPEGDPGHAGAMAPAHAHRRWRLPRALRRATTEPSPTDPDGRPPCPSPTYRPTPTPTRSRPRSRRDGAVIVDRLAPTELLDRIADELEPHLAATPTGPDDFSGFNTRRCGGLIARVPASRELVMHPLSLGRRRRAARRTPPTSSCT